MARPSGGDIREEAPIAATDLIRCGGVGAVSFGVVDEEVGERARSIHQHFASEGDLVSAVAARYRRDFVAAVVLISSASAGHGP